MVSSRLFDIIWQEAFEYWNKNGTVDRFFETHPIFSSNDLRRMEDVGFVLGFIITIMLTYFDKNREIETYLQEYNEDFEEKDIIRQNLARAFSFIEACNFDNKSRVWQKADLFTLLVELYRAIIRDGLELDALQVGENLKEFYSLVNEYRNLDNNTISEDMLKELRDYYFGSNTKLY